MSIGQWPGKTRRYFREVILEMQKVSWPSRQSVIGSTGVVLFVVALLSVYMWGLDFIWGRALNLLLKVTSG